MILTTQEAAKRLGGEVTHTQERFSQGYYFSDDTPSLKVASKAIKAIGRTPIMEISGGNSDANIFNAAGVETVNLSIGYEQVHTLDEYIPIEELEATAKLVYQLATHEDEIN